MQAFDINKEFYAAPYFNGVKLSPPTDSDKHLGVRLGAILNFPCNVYILNTESEVIDINTHSAASCGYQSINDAIGTTVFDVLQKDNARLITNVDKRVIKENRTIISEDMMIRSDEAAMNFLTVKTPIYNDENKMMGILGCSVMLNEQPLAASLDLISKIGVLKNNSPSAFLTDEYNWTPRQKQVIQLLLRGRTAREVAMMLRLSQRTVEHYIENIKSKLMVNTKSELIEKLQSILQK